MHAKQLQLCPTLCDPMDCSTPFFPVLHHLPKIAQTHVHWAADAIQPSHPLSALLLLPSIFPSTQTQLTLSAIYSQSIWHVSFLRYHHSKMIIGIYLINVFLYHLSQPQWTQKATIIIKDLKSQSPKRECLLAKTRGTEKWRWGSSEPWASEEKPEPGGAPPPHVPKEHQIGRASCRERV